MPGSHHREPQGNHCEAAPQSWNSRHSEQRFHSGQSRHRSFCSRHEILAFFVQKEFSQWALFDLRASASVSGIFNFRVSAQALVFKPLVVGAAAAALAIN